MEENQKLKRIKDNPLIYTLVLVGALIAALLVLVGTGFSKYMQMFNGGYAVGDPSIGVSLSKNPGDEEIKAVVELTPFNELEYIYKQGNKYFLGEKKKHEIQYSYPLFLEDSLRLQIVDPDTLLVDPDYEVAQAYTGMYIQQGVAYNPDGERADASDYIFLTLTNGNFVNLTDITYRYKGEAAVIPANSLIHFTKEFVSFYSVKEGEGIYGSIPFVSMEDIFFVGPDEITYKQLLLNLNVIHEVIENEPVQRPIPEPEETLEDDVQEILPETVTPEVVKPEEPEEEPAPVIRPERKEKEKKDLPPIEKPPKEPKKDDNKPGQEPTKPEKHDRGTRPGSEDKPNPDEREKVKDYVKPTVEIKTITAGVYRIMADLDVKDPAERLHSGKKAQIEVYEVDEKGNKTLIGRGYKGAPGGIITVGGGLVKPDTKYFVQVSFTYFDEYDELTVEYVGSQYVTTGKISDLGPIYLNQEIGELSHNKIQLKDIFAKDNSDDEAVYGIALTGGLSLEVDEKNGSFHTENKFDKSSISAFKVYSPTTVTSLAVLKAKTEYNYKIRAFDYFGNELTLINNTGSTKTSKNAPKADIELTKNAIGDVEFSVKIKDVDQAIIPEDENATPLKTNIYFAILPQNYYSDEKDKVEAESFYLERIDESEYTITYDASTGLYQFALNSGATEFIANKLRLDTTFVARVFADYDLDNGYGAKRFTRIGELSFKSSGLSTLGSIYISGNVTGITEDSAIIDLTLDRDRTNSELYNLLRALDLYVTKDPSKNYKDSDTTMKLGFNKDTKTNDIPPIVVYEAFINGSSYRTILDKNLTSMTDYYVHTGAVCEYDGAEYPVNVVLDISGFKTLKATPIVNIIDPVFAGGQIIFDCNVIDEDGAIIGNSGNTVVVNLYQKINDEKSVFVKRVRIDKSTNRDNPINNTVKFINLDMSKEYYVDFVAVEYNNGYTNDTFIANKIIHTELFAEGIDYTGTIRLQNLLEDTPGSDTLNGEFKITFDDETDKIPELSSGNGDYYVKLTRYVKGTENVVGKPEMIGFAKDKDEDVITWIKDFKKANQDVKVELLVKIGERELYLDEIKFSIDQEIVGFSTTYEFIKYVKENPTGKKFIATDNIELISNKTYYPIEGNTNSGPGLSGNALTSILNSDIDFQGYKLEHHFMAGGQPVFTNIGPKGSFHNCNYEITWENTGAVNDTASLCIRNYGSIKDVFVDFKGAATTANYTVGILARQNAATGVIENFVIHNNPEEGLGGFSVRNNGGLVCYNNYGVIRNGYVYGTNIYSAFYAVSDANNNVARDRMLGGICGRNYTVGQINNVYSLLGIDFEEKANIWENNRYYGTIVGYSSGYTGNMYSSNNDLFPKTNKGPVVGYVSGKKYENVFYYNKANTQYIAASGAAIQTSHNKMMSIDNLYDSGWQSVILGDQFITSNVELGYYPHVKLSPNLPEQDYIELPVRRNSSLVDISQSEVISYDNTVDKESAYIKFRFKNESNADITSIQVEGLTIELDKKTEESADGFTTIYGTASKPTMYKSAYNVEKIFYSYNGAAQKKEYTGNKPIIAVDFYRNIRTAEDWYNYMVLNAKKAADEEENVRLQADIDFANEPANRVRITDTFSSKLDGNNHIISNIDMTKDKGNVNSNNALFCIPVTSNTTNVANVSIDMTGEVKNLYVFNYKAGGQKPNRPANPTYIYSTSRAGLIYQMTGSLENVHIVNEELVGYSYIGGLVCYAYDGATITNCSVNNLTITYAEPTQEDTDAYIGGIVGRIDNGRITNCYAKNINIKANDMRNNYGTGGIVGYCNMSVIENAYATGDIEIRGNKTGGIVGEYLVTGNGDEGVICINNVISKVNILTYTDVAGGIAGSTNVTDNMISDTNNVSGVAFGDVYGYNPDVDGISHTIGRAMGKQIKLYGCDMQLINGITTDVYNPNVCLGLLSYEEATNPDIYTSKVNMSNVFNYAPVSDGNLPHLYYNGTATELPFQGTEGFDEIAINDKLNLGFDVLDVQTDINSGIIRIKCRIPNNAEIVDYKIEDLAVNDDFAVDYDYVNGHKEGVLLITYKDEIFQEHCLDSYVLSSVSLKINGSVTKVGLITRIPVTLYHTISQTSDWDAISVDYENYRVVADLDFSQYAENGYANKRIGRIQGRNTANPENKAVFKGINLKVNKNNFISRLNSSIDNVIFKDVTIANSGKNGIGLVGASFAEIKNTDFENITIDCKANNAYIGIIGYQVANKIHDCNLTNVRVNMNEQTRKMTYVGSLCGYMADLGEVTNIKISDSQVYGYNYTGGLVGFSYAISYDNIEMEDMLVRANLSGAVYCGGMVGLMGNTDVCHSSAHCDNIYIHGEITNAGESSPINTTVLNVDGTTNRALPADSVEKGATSTFTVEGYNQVGGISGRAYVDSGTIVNTHTDTIPYNIADTYANNPYYSNIVSGIRVNGYGDYIGGAFGYNIWYENWTEINDCYIYAKNLPSEATAVKGNVGAFAGRGYRRLSLCNVRNCYIETENYNYVGALCGTIEWASISYNTVEDSFVEARVTAGNEGARQDVGGLVGYTINNQHVQYCMVFNTSVDAPGHKNVGGIIGRHLNVNNNGYISYAQCLGDVDPAAESTIYAATAKDMYVLGYDNVGGIAGYQNSGYMWQCTTNVKVEAVGTDSCAGGLAGYYNNAYTSNANGTKTASTARCYYNMSLGSVKGVKYAGGLFGRTGMCDKGLASGLRQKNVNGSSYDEATYTYSNLEICSSIKAANAHPIAGDVENFSARTLRAWTETLINDVNAYSATTLATVDMSNVANVDCKAFGSAAYVTKLVTTDDLKNEYLYYNINFLERLTSVSTPGRGIYRVFITGKDSATTYGYARATGTYLPIIRQSTTTTMSADRVLRLQKRFMADAETRWLPVPNGVPRALRANASAAPISSLTDNEPAVYASSVNTVNITWPEGMVMDEEEGCYYYELLVDGESIVKEPINKRTVSFTYDYISDIQVTYGEIIPDGENVIYDEYKSLKYEAMDVANRIEVFKDKYYYISNGVLKSGKINTKPANASDDLFVNIYAGYAMNYDGEIISLTDNSVIGYLGETEVLDDAIPMYQFKLSGYTFDTFNTYTTIYSKNSVFDKDGQIFVYSGALCTIDNRLKNDKDALLVYRNNEENYQTVLMKSGEIADLYSEAPILPEKFTNAGIVDMTNNICSTIPVALVEYADGGFVGYNYLTGELLFEDNVKPASLMDYLSDKLTDVVSPEIHINKDNYRENKEIADALNKGQDVLGEHGEKNGISKDDKYSGDGYGQGTGIGNKDNSTDGKNYGENASTSEGENLNKNKDSYEYIDGDGELVTDEAEAEGDGISDGKGSDKTGPSKVSENGKDTDNEKQDGEVLAELENEEKPSENNEKASASGIEPTTDKAGNTITKSASNGTIITTVVSPSLVDTMTSTYEVASDSVYMIVFNATTGSYDVVNSFEYITDPEYVSENERIGVTDLTEVANIVAVAGNNKKDANGLLIYIAVASVTLLVAGIFIIVDRKRRKNG